MDARESDEYTVSIDALAQPASLQDVLQTSRGYVRFRDGETARPASPAVLVNGIEHQAHLQAVHTAVGPTRDLGIYMLPQAIVSGHCFVFANGHLIVDGSILSEVAVKWAAEEGYLGAGNKKPEILVELTRPALVIAGPGYNVWGHWLLDFMPRLAIAQSVLGAALDGFAIPLPADTPKWAIKAMEFFCRLDTRNIVFYRRGAEGYSCRNGVIIPTYARSDHCLHSFCKEFYSSFIRQRKRRQGKRRLKRICVSRRGHTRESWGGPIRFFEQREYFETVAEKRDFALVYPEELNFRQQIDLFSEAEIIVGEYGSGMHNALFAPSGTIVGQFVMSNPIQSRIAGLCGHRMIFLVPDVHPKFDEPAPARMDVSPQSIDEFFAAIDEIVAGKVETPSTGGGSAIAHATTMKRSEVLQPILELYTSPRYLEIGVNTGETFFALSAARKVAVDPNFRFDIKAAQEREEHASFFEIESDRYFENLIEQEEKFDVIYLDGLHVFEQTLRDFTNALYYLTADGVIVVDDVVPSSYAASLPNEEAAVRLKHEINEADQSWMGDVYRLVFFIEAFYPQYDYATVIENHGQLVVWRSRRNAPTVTHGSVRQIAEAPYESVFLNSDAFRRRPYAEIIELLRNRDPRSK
jgi:predicted O-methyltransferase YrrM